MKKIYSPEIRVCLQCGETFSYTKDRWSEPRGRGKYCSRECADKSRGDPPVEITCLCGCGRKRLVQASRVKQGNGKFFSKECVSKYKREHRPWKTCAFPGCTNKFQVMPWEMKFSTHRGAKGYCDEHKGTHNPAHFKNGEEHRRWSEKIEVSCACCGKKQQRLLSEHMHDLTRGRKVFFCCVVCRRKWHEANIRGVNHPNYNPDKQVHYVGFTPKSRERCRDLWGRKSFISGIDESENLGTNGRPEKLTCHHIDGNKDSLLIIPITRKEHDRITGEGKNGNGNPDETAKVLLEKLTVRLKTEFGWTLDQYVAFLATGIRNQTQITPASVGIPV